MPSCLPRMIPTLALLLPILSLAACGDESAALSAEGGVLDGRTADRGQAADSRQQQEDSAVDLVLLSDATADLPGLPEDSGAAGDQALPPDVGQPDAPLVSDATQGCQVWEITYDLTGSVFEISGTPFGAGDQLNTVMEPYDEDDHLGPGSFVLRLANVNGAPGGPATIYSHEMSMHFVVDSGLAVVATDLETDAGPAECGVTRGTLSGTTMAWDPSAIVGLHLLGQMLCTGTFCSLGGFPNGVPVPMDEIVDQPLGDFVFASDFSSFSMAQTVVKQDQNSTSSWTYVGTEVSRQLIAAPGCLCP